MFLCSKVKKTHFGLEWLCLFLLLQSRAGVNQSVFKCSAYNPVSYDSHLSRVRTTSLGAFKEPWVRNKTWTQCVFLSKISDIIKHQTNRGDGFTQGRKRKVMGTGN